MTFISDNLQILATLGSALAVYLFIRAASRKDVGLLKEEMNRRFDVVDRRFVEIDRRFEEIDRRFEEIDRRFGDIDRRFAEVENNFSSIKRELKEIKEDVKDIKRDLNVVRDRATKLEGRFEERGYWESRKPTGTDGD